MSSTSKNEAASPTKELNAKDFMMSFGNLKLDEIVGQDEAVAELWNLVHSIKYHKIYSYWNIGAPKGIILNGPPGTGKTASVRALCKEVQDDVYLLELRYLDIASRWVDMPIEQLRTFFTNAEKLSKEKHVIIFIDELDSMIPNRDNQIHELSMKRVNVFLEWMDGGFHSYENITLIGATNYIEGIDKAAKRPGRFDKIVEYKELNRDSIIKGLQIHLSKKNLDSQKLEEIDWTQIESILFDGALTGAELPDVVTRAINKKVTEHVQAVKKVDFSSLSKEKQNAFMSDKANLPSPISTEDIKNIVVKIIEDNKRNQHDSARPIGFAAACDSG